MVLHEQEQQAHHPQGRGLHAVFAVAGSSEGSPA
jgi:hypothetical protein